MCLGGKIGNSRQDAYQSKSLTARQGFRSAAGRVDGANMSLNLPSSNKTLLTKITFLDTISLVIA